jgi:phosphoribosylanthranilate isomerase
MALKTKVKVGRITNLSDARYCAGMGVDMLGFSISGPSSISFEKFKEINGWITGPQLVLEIHSIEDLDKAAATFFSNHLEVSVNLLPLIKQTPETSLIVRINLNSWNENNLNSFKGMIEYVVVEDYTSEQKETLQKISREYSILIEPGIDAADVNELLNLPISGIALNGSDELKPGLKEYNQLSEILEQLDVD